MLRHLPLLRVWRGLLAALLVLGLWSASPKVEAAPPSWMAAAICHVATGDETPQPSPIKAALHHHCDCCQIGSAVALPAGPIALPRPRLVTTVSVEITSTTNLRTENPAAYAPRGPPLAG